jgi:hypothetical protein
MRALRRLRRPVPIISHAEVAAAGSSGHALLVSAETAIRGAAAIAAIDHAPWIILRMNGRGHRADSAKTYQHENIPHRGLLGSSGSQLLTPRPADYSSCSGLAPTLLRGNSVCGGLACAILARLQAWVRSRCKKLQEIATPAVLGNRKFWENCASEAAWRLDRACGSRRGTGCTITSVSLRPAETVSARGKRVAGSIERALVPQPSALQNQSDRLAKATARMSLAQYWFSVESFCALIRHARYKKFAAKTNFVIYFLEASSRCPRSVCVGPHKFHSRHLSSLHSAHCSHGGSGNSESGR